MVVERAWKSLDLVFLFSIKDSALSSFFLWGFRGFTEASLGSQELQRFFSFCSCCGISKHSGRGGLSLGLNGSVGIKGHAVADVTGRCLSVYSLVKVTILGDAGALVSLISSAP